MATDPNAVALVKTLALQKKAFVDQAGRYYAKFVKGTAVPTASDVEAAKKALGVMRRAANLMHADVAEAQQAMAGLGGMGDTILMGFEETIKTMEKHVHH